MIVNGPYLLFFSATTHGIQKFPLKRRQWLLYLRRTVAKKGKEIMGGFLLKVGLKKIIGLLICNPILGYRRIQKEK